jgi:FtsP/CotA-like multicopper oxidase with cupredoxin domain
MPWRLENGVKVFDITVGHVRTEFIPGRVVDAWGFNDSMPGPTIQVNEGDHVRLIVENRLPEPFSMHWHGLEIPNDMDGMPGISQELIPPGGKFVYEFTLHQNGTFFYHSHMAMQEMMGLIGLFIIHPRRAHTPHVDRDFGIILQGWAILPNNTVPNSLAMEFNWLTMNGKAGPATTPMLCRLGERVRIRIVNLGMDHHPIHLHGHQFYVTGTEGGRIRTTAVEPANTVLVGVAQARDVEFVANNEGDWHFHCHLPHHMMNQMVSMVGPNMMSHANTPRPGTMEAGMGIVEGRALDESSGPAFGRAIGVGAEAERPVPNMPLAAQIRSAAPDRLEPPNAGMFPGYPQDMFMVMDDMVAKPETYGLRPGWSGGTMGMMTIVRVLGRDLFDKIQALKAEARKVDAR